MDMSLEVRFIPENVIQKKRIFGIRKRNLIEGLVWGFVLIILLGRIPFTPRARLIISVGCILLMELLNILGIKGLTFTQAIWSVHKYKPFLNKYEYRRLNRAKEPVELFEEKKDGTIIVKTVKDNEIINKAASIIGVPFG